MPTPPDPSGPEPAFRPVNGAARGGAVPAATAVASSADTPADDRPLLRIDSLTTSFGRGENELKAVDDISIAVRPGHTLGVVGESGSGKSITSLTVMRLLPRTARVDVARIGFVDRDGRDLDLAELPEREMQDLRGDQLAMIFQEPGTSLNPVFTVGAQVVEAIRRHNKVSKREARARTIELFEEVKIPDAAARFRSYPHEMSGGQKQRVMIAMALSCNPRLLIADEPTTALDVTIQQEILDLLRELRDERQMAMLFITHDLGVIAEIADDVAVMYRGDLVESGPVLDIFTDPKHPYTRGLLACRPKLDTTYRRLPTVADFMTVEPGGRLIEKELTPERRRILETAGRGPLLHPEAKLKAMGHPVDATGHEARTSARPGTKCLPPEARPLLSVRNLKVHYPVRGGLLRTVKGHVKAVDGVSFDIYPGQTLGLVGESGCGKTTTGRAIVRLTPITDGQINFEGRNVAHLSGGDLTDYRSKVQIIFQDPYGSLNPRLTVSGALTAAMRTHHVGETKADRRKMAAALLEEVGLSASHLGRYPHEFSGGQRQRICIARALAVEPSFIICDESVSALDVSVQAQVCNLLKDLQQRRGLTYLFISHDLSVVKFMSDMMAVMQPVPLEDETTGKATGRVAGRIVEFGPADAIYADPQQDYTRRLIDAIPTGDVDELKQRLQRRRERREAAAAPAS